MEKIKRKFKYWYTIFWEQKQYYRNLGTGLERILEELRNQECQNILITIAFNNAEVINTQIEKIKKFCCSEKYIYLVMDNSSDEGQKKKILETCINTGTYYFSMPINPYIDCPSSASHGVALNWVWKNVVVKVLTIKRVLFLDHDIFPYKQFSVEEMLKDQIAYGLKEMRDKSWYIWPGYCALNVDRLRNRKVNFMPGKYGDTGSTNYKLIYKYCNMREMKFAHLQLIETNETVDKEKRNVQKDCVDFIDDSWIHMINGSNWAEDENVEQKYRKVMDLLSGL